MLYVAGWSLEWCLKRWGEKWQIRGIGDTAVVPMVILLVSIIGFVATPLLNTHTRTTEYEADMYGLNASRQPDGFAQAAIHLGEYRRDASRSGGRVHLLRPSQRLQPNLCGDALEEGKLEAIRTSVWRTSWRRRRNRTVG